MMPLQPAKRGKNKMSENAKETGNCPKEAVAQLKASIAKVATLPKTAKKGMDTADR